MRDLSKYVPDYVSVRRALAIGLFLLCSTAAWLRGGVYPPLQWPLVLLAVLLCATALFLRTPVRDRVAKDLRKDPALYAGALLLFLILLQSLHSGFGPEGGPSAELARTPSRWLPWSMDPEESRQMLAWFFPAWVVLLLARHTLERRHVKLLLRLLVWNSALLACVSILVYLLGSDRLLGIWETDGRWVFSSFDYPNHASAWFYMNAFISAGLLHEALHKRRSIVELSVWGVLFLLCTAAAALSLSRFGAFVSMLLLLAMLAIFLKIFLPRVRGAAAVNVVVVAVIVMMAGVTLFRSAGGGTLAREVSEKAIFGEFSVAADFAGRMDQIPNAWRAFTEYPLFGTGGWGYRWLLPQYISVEAYETWDRMGWFNVHCDPLQFLSEFGVLGATCIALAVGLLVSRLIRARPYSRTALWIMAGLGVVGLHSLFDFPFRSPAILFEWVMLLALVPKVTRAVTAHAESSHDNG